MHIDHRQLLELAADVDEQNRAAMQTITDEIGEVHFGPAGEELRDARRRSFLTKAAVAAPLVAVGAAALPVTRLLPTAVAAAADAAALTDVDIASFAVTVELAAVQAYKAAAGTGKLSAAAKSVGTMFAEHHAGHAGAFTSLVSKLTAPPPQTPNAAILKAFGPQITGAADEAALLEIARQIEEAAAATYLWSLGLIQNKAAAGAVGTILPVESQHAVVLATALKKPAADYLPGFQTGTAYLDPAKYPPGPAPADTSGSTDTGSTTS